MRKIGAAFLLAMCFCASAHAGRVRDMSMPLNESLSVPDNSSSQAGMGYPGNVGGAGAGNSGNPDVSKRLAGTRRGDDDSLDAYSHDGGGFSATYGLMEQYCGGSTPAMGLRSSEWSACLEQFRDQYCQRYSVLPVDIRRVVNGKLECEQVAGGYMGEEGGQVYDRAYGDCARVDAENLRLLRKYWEDMERMHALLFFAQEFNHATDACLGTADSHVRGPGRNGYRSGRWYGGGRY